jgi:lipoprotein-releasing system permease protein
MSTKGRIIRRIANRMSSSNKSSSSWARPVVKIATAGIALGLGLIIISTAIVQGFQSEIRDLVIGFGSHIHIVPSDPENDGLVMDSDLLSQINDIQGVKSVAPWYLMPGLLETDKSLKGVTVKGIDLNQSGGFNSNTELISESLISGRLPKDNSDVLISVPLANTLELDTNDRISLYLVIKDEDVKPRVVKVCGVYETGLLEYDERFIFVNSTLLQEVANRGVQAVIYINESPYKMGIRGASFGKTLENEIPVGRWEPEIDILNPDTAIEYLWIVGEHEIQDTAYLFYSEGKWNAQAGNGSWQLFAEGYEVYIDHYQDLAYIDEEILYTIPHTLTTNKITDQSREIFSWLGMLDLNVIVIIGLMVLISIINMVSALLIVILERRSQVGLLKALGMRDSSVIQLFVQYAARIIGGGFLIGNIIGFTICIIQKQTGFISLDPAAYYVSEVPILFDFSRLVFIEVAAFAACIISMLLPAWYSTRILPSTALRIK